MASNVLTKEQLRNYNVKMLNLGAPVKYDWQGYNKFHYNAMKQLIDVKNLSDKQALWIAKTLKYYVNTQLTEIKEIIKSTIAFYAQKVDNYHNNVSKTLESNPIKVAGINDQQCTLIWDFDKQVNNKLKDKLDKSQFSWAKNKNSWLLNINRQYLEQAIKIFNDVGLDTSNIVSSL